MKLKKQFRQEILHNNLYIQITNQIGWWSWRKIRTKVKNNLDQSYNIFNKFLIDTMIRYK